MPELAEIRKSSTGWNQSETANELARVYFAMHSKPLSVSYALKRLSLIESGASDATDLELAALAAIYKRDVDELRQAAVIGRQSESLDQTGEQFFAELKNTPDSQDLLLCSVYGGSRSAVNDDDDEYGRLLIESLQTAKSNVKLAMYLPYPERSHFSTRGGNPDSMRLISAYETARAYAHDRFEVIRRQVHKGSVALYEPNVKPYLGPGEEMQPYLAPFNIRQTLLVTIDKSRNRRIPLKKRLFAWTHDERPSGGTIPRDLDRDSTLRQQMQAAWTAWMGEPLACWEQCGRLGDAPSLLSEVKRKKFHDFQEVGKCQEWGWKKTELSRSISHKYTEAERAGSLSRRDARPH